MPTAIWFALKKSLQLDRKAATPPQLQAAPKSPLKIRSGRCGSCSRSISNLRDVVNGCSSRRRSPPSDLIHSCSSPKSMASSELMNPITHEVVFNNSKCEIKIMGVGGTRGNSKSASAVGGCNLRGGSSNPGPNFLGTLRPGTPGPRGGHGSTYKKITGSGSGSSEQPSTPTPWGGSGRLKLKGNAGVNDPHISGSSSSSVLMCQKCGEEFTKLEAVEAHHLSNHAGI